MDRIYDFLLKKHFSEYRQMAFLSGPRQVGKTTLAMRAEGANQPLTYLNWDNPLIKTLINEGFDALAKHCGIDMAGGGSKPMIVFDEIHKFSKWKNYVKGFFDQYGERCQIIVTGSARLDLYKRGGDSLRGRYFHYRVHPLSIGEVTSPLPFDGFFRAPRSMPANDLKNLFTFGGFPEPFLQGSEMFHRKWSQMQREQILKQELRDLTAVRELSQIDLLAILLTEQAGGAVNFTRLAKHLQASADSVRRWCSILESLYFCFFVRPYSRNITRSLLKEPKVYLWDWSVIADEGRRWENFVASHLWKAAQYWSDLGLANCSLHFLRDKEKREVDFAMIRDRKPWFLVEVKSSASESCNSNLEYFQNATKAEHAFQTFPQVDAGDIDCFSLKEPTKIPMPALLCRLP